MRILFFFPRGNRWHQPAAHWTILYQGLVQAGHEVHEYPAVPGFHLPSEPAEGFSLTTFGNPVPVDDAATERMIRERRFDVVLSGTRPFAMERLFRDHYPWSALVRFGKLRFTRRRALLAGNFFLAFRSSFQGIPSAVVDMQDHNVIARQNLALLSSCDLYFKRELQYDAGKALPHPELPFRTVGPRQAAYAKLRPIPMGINLDALDRKLAARPAPPIRYDLSFVGHAYTNSLRPELARRLERLAGRHRVFLQTEGGVPQDQYLDIIRASRVGVSIEGNGYECFRHYEVAGCGAALLVSAPTIRTHRFFEDGRSAVFFRPDLGDFEERVDWLLADEARRLEIARRGRKHLEGQLTARAIAEYVLDELKAVRSGEGGRSDGRTAGR